MNTTCRASGWHNGIMELNASGDVRVRAKSQGFQVGDRGRLSAAVVEAYQAAVAVDAATPVRRPARKAPNGTGKGPAVAADLMSPSVTSPSLPDGLPATPRTSRSDLRRRLSSRRWHRSSTELLSLRRRWQR